MGFRRLFGTGDEGDGQEPPEIDTQILSVTLLPGHEVEGEVTLRGGSKGLKVEHLDLDVVAKAHYYDGKVNEETVTGLDARRYSLDVAPGAEERSAFGGRLPWECPVTELGGRALGVDVSLTTKLSWESDSPVKDLDFLHIAAPPVYEAVLDAFAEEGYRVEGSQLMDEYIPDVEANHGLHQVFFLGNPTRADRFGELEVVFFQNAVGVLVFVRRAARSVYEWEEKPPHRTFPAAHHEVGQADLGERVREALTTLTLMDG
ncbi:sporulation protein [Streptomyces sp. NPDC050504]|uniref:sporulation protein n=1 Tax=Streptomyces sp. NPDC050504 TaxID=3365618 RepID=UPI0037A0628B